MLLKANKSGKDGTSSGQELNLDDFVSLFTEMVVTADVQYIFNRYCHTVIFQ